MRPWFLFLLFGVVEAAAYAGNFSGARLGGLEAVLAPPALVCTLFALARRRLGSGGAAVVACGLMGVVIGLAFMPLRSRPESGIRLEIRKQQRELLVLEHGKRTDHYRVALSCRPEGDKLREGDLRVPVGRFFVCEREAGPPFHRWLGLSYPSPAHADRARGRHAITWAEWWLLRVQGQNGLAPFQRTGLGGALGIHGGGSRKDWTLGCVALEDRDVEALFERAPLGTPVVVLP